MADSDKPKLKGPLKPGEEPGAERRLLLAFGLMGLVLLLAQYLYKPTAPQKTDLKQVETPSAPQAAKPTPPPAPVTPPAGQVAAEREQFFTIETDLYRVVFSNHGAVVRSWELKNYLDGSGKGSTW
jgi:YidC/Oxa1 family membrane protein insertase